VVFLQTGCTIWCLTHCQSSEILRKSLNVQTPAHMVASPNTSNMTEAFLTQPKSTRFAAYLTPWFITIIFIVTHSVGLCEPFVNASSIWGNMNGWLQILRSCMIVFISILAPPRPYTKVYKTQLNSFHQVLAGNIHSSVRQATQLDALKTPAHKAHQINLSSSHPLDQRCRSRQREYLFGPLPQWGPPKRSKMCRSARKISKIFWGIAPDTHTGDGTPSLDTLPLWTSKIQKNRIDANALDWSWRCCTSPYHSRQLCRPFVETTITYHLQVYGNQE